VKLANIHLTPEKPSYDGGTWHVEGQLNENMLVRSLPLSMQFLKDIVVRQRCIIMTPRISPRACSRFASG
jgi:hypothetical protein